MSTSSPDMHLTLPPIGQAPPGWPALDTLGIATDWFNPDLGTARRMLIILAHRDDETFSCGATIARAVASGTIVHFVCATRGECGVGEPALLATEPIANVRTAELRCAAHSLGLHAIHFLNYRDSGMAGSPESRHAGTLTSAPVEEIVGKLATLLRAVQPEVVVTHGPYGGYGHPDHVRIHDAVLDAWHIVGDKEALSNRHMLDLAPWQPSRPYTITFDPRPLKLFTLLLRLARRDPARFGDNGDVNLQQAAQQATPVMCRPNLRQWAAAKERAARCHSSQLGPYRLLLRLPRPLRARFIASEGYTRLTPAVAPNESVEGDLFLRPG